MAENTANPQIPPAQPDPSVTEPETVVPETPVVPPTTPPATPPETPPTTPVQPEPVQMKPDKPMSDEQLASITESVTKDVSGKVSKSVIQKIGDALGLTKKEEEELPTDPIALKKLVDQEVTKRFDKVSEDSERQQKEDETARQGRVDGIVTGWNFQYNELSKIGKVPAIKNVNDTNDEGVKARRKLITAIGNIIDEIRKVNPNSDYVPSISEALVRYPQVLQAPPGANLPISGNTAVRETEDSFSYEKDIAGKSFQQIIDEGEQG
jgi:hypothetical protein